MLKEIEAIREKYFLANNRPQKLQYTRQEQACRDQLDQALTVQKEEWAARQQRDIDERVARIPNPKDRVKLREDELKKYSLREKRFDASLEAARKVAHWKPYDQNAKADWFESEYMFGITRGFDVVIGNPPYIQLQKNRGELRRRYQYADFETFASTGDIYQLFYEKGCQLLTPQSGLLCYITSNSWLRAEYGKSTRRYFAEQQTPLQLLEMGKDIFENAIVDTNILVMREGKSNETGRAVDMDHLLDKNFPPSEHLWGTFQPQSEKPWSALSAIEQPIMDKMETAGVPLKEWDISIYRGVLTGYNQAFIIDNQTKEALIERDPKSAEVIKPVLRGRDIQRYQADWKSTKLWLIATFPAIGLNIDDYPEVKRHLLSFGKARLEQSGRTLANGTKSRKKTTHAWYELQDTCAYHAEFKKEKLIWMDMSDRGRFAYLESEMYCNNKGFIMTGESLKYLCAILNSSLITWLMKNTARTTGMGLTQWEKFAVERLPIPKLSTGDQYRFIELIEHILTAKAADPNADISATEAEIDLRVYELYELTTMEISAIEEHPLL